MTYPYIMLFTVFPEEQVLRRIRIGDLERSVPRILNSLGNLGKESGDHSGAPWIPTAPSVVWGPAASGSLLKAQRLRSHPGLLTESESDFHKIARSFLSPLRFEKCPLERM